MELNGFADLLEPDTTPALFFFAPILNAETGVWKEGEEFTVSEINMPTDCTITNGEVSINVGAFSPSSAMVVAGDKIKPRCMSAATYNSPTSAVITVGTRSAVLSIMTRLEDRIPGTIAFSPINDVDVDVWVEYPQLITVDQVDISTDLSVVNMEYSLDNLNWFFQPMVVPLGAQIKVRVKSSTAYNDPKTGTLILGGQSADLVVTTKVQAPPPPPPPPTSPAKMGVGIDSVTRRTIFAAVSPTLVNSDSGLASAITQAKTNTSIELIQLAPGSYNIASRALGGLNRLPTRPLVIRGGTGVSLTWGLQDFNFEGFALVDVKLTGLARILSAGTTKNILFENVEGWMDVQGQRISGAPGATVKNLNMRFCRSYNHWSASGLAHGFFIFNYEDLSLEYNLLDHNGWKDGATRALPSAQGGGDMRKHNIYLAGPGLGNTIVRNNVIANGSSHGIHIRRGGLLENNLFIKNPITWQFGYGGDGYAATMPIVQGGEVKNNVIVGTDDINTAENNLRGIGGWFTYVDGVAVDNNLFLMNTTSAVNDAVLYLEQDYKIVMTASNNRAFQWNGGVRKMSSGVVAQIVETNNNWNVPQYGQVALANQVMSQPFIDDLRLNGVNPTTLENLLITLRSG